MNKKLKEYQKLLNMNYDQAVDCLKQKYGDATDDYFVENSYKNFMSEKSGNPIRGKYSRTRDGLYCHHIREDKYLNLTTKEFCKMQNVPFAMHKKENLVYADLIEHLILHLLIANKTNNKFGAPGFIVYLYPQAINWYIRNNKPNITWQKNCYEKAFLNVDEAKRLLLSDIPKYANSELKLTFS